MSLVIRSWRGPRSLAPVAFVVLLSAVAAAGAASEGPSAAPEKPDGRRLAACELLAVSPWPRTPAERRALLQRLGDAREACKDHPAFLATLGGNWLEEGDASQALLWLERALLLDPSQMGARADYALALAALGDLTARDELVAAWRDRPDVPLLLRARLAAAGVVAPPPNGSNGAPPVRPRWAQIREATALAGYETNLDRSPRLNELTITRRDNPPEQLPIEPLRPRPGAAAALDLAWQVAYSPDPVTVAQGGVQAAGRSAPGARDTDWHNLLMAASISRRWGAWRAQLHGAMSWFGGDLGEPYRLDRVSTSLETGVIGCTLRLSTDWERRVHRESSLNNGTALSGLWNTLCPVPYPRGWTFGLAARASTDKPSNELRAGGVQRLFSGGVRFFGPLASGFQLDISARATRALDSDGYSPLLESNARRWLRPVQLNLELSHLLERTPLGATEGVWQLQAVRQTSNLAFFEYTSASLFGGLRWRW